MIQAKEFSSRDLFGRHNGMEVLSAEKGRARARCEVRPHHLNGLGTVHGGALFTLADLAFAAASNCADETVVSVNATIAFVKAGAPGAVLFADAQEVARSSKLVHYDIKVTDQDGTIFAIFHGTGYIKRKKEG